MSALARIDNLSVRYGGGAPVLSDISLEIGIGERLAIIGESGSGKSTLARALAGLLPGTARLDGRITWPGLSAAPRAGADIGFVFQDPGMSLDPVLSVGEQIAEAARIRPGVTWHEAYAHAEALLGRVQLPDPPRTLRAFPHQLSGGQRQRVAIAAAIAAGPKLLIADEATSALDMVVQAGIVSLLDRLVAEDGMTLIFITHDIALAAQLAETIAVFRDGRLVETGPAQDLLRAAKSDYTRSLVAAHIGLDAPLLIEPAP